MSRGLLRRPGEGRGPLSCAVSPNVRRVGNPASASDRACHQQRCACAPTQRRSPHPYKGLRTEDWRTLPPRSLSLGSPCGVRVGLAVRVGLPGRVGLAVRVGLPGRVGLAVVGLAGWLVRRVAVRRVGGRRPVAGGCGGRWCGGWLVRCVAGLVVRRVRVPVRRVGWCGLVVGGCSGRWGGGSDLFAVVVDADVVAAPAEEAGVVVGGWPAVLPVFDVVDFADLVMGRRSRCSRGRGRVRRLRRRRLTLRRVWPRMMLPVCLLKMPKRL